MDMYDLKPDAPVEYRGEFKPIQTNVPGMQISEHLPLHAKIADKFAIVRNMKFQQEGHTAPELYTGFLRGNRPSFGSVVSKLRADAGVRSPLPPYVYLGDANHVGAPGLPGQGARSVHPRREGHEPRAVEGDQPRTTRRAPRTAEVLRRDETRPRRPERQPREHGCVHGAGAGHDDDRRGPRRVRPLEGAGEAPREVRQGHRVHPGAAAGGSRRAGGDDHAAEPRRSAEVQRPVGPPRPRLRVPEGGAAAVRPQRSRAASPTCTTAGWRTTWRW